jgi:hypothetical protein
MKSVGIIAIVAVAMIGVMVPNVFAFTTMLEDGKPKGHVPVLDEKIVIVQHNGLSYLQDSLDWYSSGSIIYGDIVNVSDDPLYYVIIRGNVYDYGKLLDDTGYMQPYIFRYDSLLEDKENITLAISPFKTAIMPGESAQFSLWPGKVGWDCYEVWIESYELENKFKGISEERLRNDIEIKSVKDELGVLKGKIYNPTENILDKPFVIVSKYDENGKLFAIKGDATSSLSPGGTQNFEIPLYLDKYPVKTPEDNFIYGKPASYEISAWGYTSWKVSDKDEMEFRGNPIKYLAASKFHLDKDIVSGIDIDNIVKTKSEKITSSCLNDTDQEFITTAFKKQLPDWIKNNVGWWANDDIDEKEFLTTLDYLLKNEFLIINIPREEFHMELDSQTYYVTKYNSAKIKISGWYEEAAQQSIICDLWEPDEVYATKITLLRTGGGGNASALAFGNAAHLGNFEQIISLNLDWGEGTYSLECNYLTKHLTTLSFDIIHGESPQVEKIIKSKVPSWIKNNAGWWADGTIDELTFLSGLEYLVQNRIIDAGRYN